MDTQSLYALTALFDTPDDVVHAADTVASAGYTKFDVNTPYPVHGMDRAMKLKPSRLGFFALAFGLLGAFSAVGFISWVAVVDYPLVIGGKPFWSWPAFVPVSFELTVLLASVLSVVAMIVIYFKFPNNSHPLHDTPYMRHVSSDKFGICVLATDPQFEEATVRKLLASLNGKDIAPVYYVFDDINHGQSLFDPKFIAVLVLTAAVVSGATYVTFNKLLFIEPFTWMSDQPKLKAQKPSSLFNNGIGMRGAVPGTVARGSLPYAFAGKPDTAAAYLVNPLVPTEEVMKRGREKYLTFCSPCHGNVARGDSRLRGQFPNPPTLHSDKVRNWPDARIYAVITDGQNVMPSYASQIPRDDRWAIIQYVRVLQRSQNPKESDLK